MVGYFDSDGTRIPVAGAYVPDYHRTAAIECVCKRRARFRSFRQSIPPAFRSANLSRLKPRIDRHEGQGEIIDYVKDNPLLSYAFCGRNRAGKSHIGWCIARNAYLSGRKVVSCNLSLLLDEYRATERPVRDDDSFVAPKPQVVSGDLVVKNVHYCLFIQEFDKPRATLYAAEKLFDLIDTAFNYEHQIVITSNLSMPELSRQWSEHGSRYGNGIISRLAERCVEVNLF